MIGRDPQQSKLIAGEIRARENELRAADGKDGAQRYIDSVVATGNARKKDLVARNAAIAADKAKKLEAKKKDEEAKKEEKRQEEERKMALDRE